MRPDGIAIHEAGHAVAAWRTGALGVVAWPYPVPSIAPDSRGLCRWYTEAGPEDLAVSMLAGRAAERHLLGREHHPSCYADDEADAAAKVGTGLALDLARCKATAMVIRYQREVFALAARMQARGVVTSSDLYEVCGCSPGIEAMARRLADDIHKGLRALRAARKRKADR